MPPLIFKVLSVQLLIAVVVLETTPELIVRVLSFTIVVVLVLCRTPVLPSLESIIVRLL